jgi:hypothetical protein
MNRFGAIALIISVEPSVSGAVTLLASAPMPSLKTLVATGRIISIFIFCSIGFALQLGLKQVFASNENRKI